MRIQYPAFISYYTTRMHMRRKIPMPKLVHTYYDRAVHIFLYCINKKQKHLEIISLRCHGRATRLSI